jgi:hypothetical protein
MKLKVLAFTAALISGVFAVGATAAENHELQAFIHAKAAVEHGEMGHANLVAEHARAALTHAEAAEQEQKNAHMEEGIVHLKAAIEHGDLGHAEVATEHAKAAFEHIKLAGR